MRATDEFKNRFYYHGTSSATSSEKIIESGYLKSGLSTYPKEYQPIDGMVYITPDPRLAIAYSFGYTTLEEYEGLFYTSIREASYVARIDGKDLKTIQPDEDFLAFALYEYFLSHYSEDERQLAGGNIEEVRMLTDDHWLRVGEYVDRSNVFSRKDIRKLKKVMGNDIFIFCLKKSREWVSKMNKKETEYWLRTGCSIAHYGVLPVDAVMMLRGLNRNKTPISMIEESEVIYTRRIS